eukprot:3215820-Rhodomonas_salina.1
MVRPSDKLLEQVKVEPGMYSAVSVLGRELELAGVAAHCYHMERADVLRLELWRVAELDVNSGKENQ